VLITSAMSCSTIRIATPRSATRVLRIRPNSSVSPPSSPEDGSSRSITWNSPAMHRASSTNRRCPVERSAGLRPASPVIPHSSIAASLKRRSSAFSAFDARRCANGLRPAIPASLPNATFSCTVSVSKSSIRWNVRPNPFNARACGEAPVMSSPNSRTRPAVGFTTPVQALNVVVLPAPLGPINPVMRPRGAVNV
jgi:hypothetical protein